MRKKRTIGCVRRPHQRWQSTWERITSSQLEHAMDFSEFVFEFLLSGWIFLRWFSKSSNATRSSLFHKCHNSTHTHIHSSARYHSNLFQLNLWNVTHTYQCIYTYKNTYLTLPGLSFLEFTKNKKLHFGPPNCNRSNQSIFPRSTSVVQCRLCSHTRSSQATQDRPRAIQTGSNIGKKKVDGCVVHTIFREPWTPRKLQQRLGFQVQLIEFQTYFMPRWRVFSMLIRIVQIRLKKCSVAGLRCQEVAICGHTFGAFWGENQDEVMFRRSKASSTVSPAKTVYPE